VNDEGDTGFYLTVGIALKAREVIRRSANPERKGGDDEPSDWSERRDLSVYYKKGE